MLQPKAIPGLTIRAQPLYADGINTNCWHLKPELKFLNEDICPTVEDLKRFTVFPALSSNGVEFELFIDDISRQRSAV